MKKKATSIISPHLKGQWSAVIHLVVWILVYVNYRSIYTYK